MDLELEGRAAIVTGGSRGIGKAIARALALEGVDVAIVARGSDALAAAASELVEETGRRIVPIPADTGNDEPVRAMVDRAHEELGRVDILVNNAAAPGGGPVPTLSELGAEHFFSEMNVKVMGYLRCAQAVAPIMQARGWGRIINISGLAARMSGSIVGSMRNVAVAAMTKNLADLLGPDGINVTVVHPGGTRTERTIELVARHAADQGVPESEIEAQLDGTNSIRHFLDASEVAWVVTFLASPKSIAINGDAVSVGGGMGNAIHY
ncbi:MAG: short-chain dehydrogenase [Deltaproteobacteria bacterium]|nr:short-chain dehydrogenase [Deltaproteobacteria bacterium]